MFYLPDVVTNLTFPLRFSQAATYPAVVMMAKSNPKARNAKWPVLIIGGISWFSNSLKRFKKERNIYIKDNQEYP